LEEAPANSGVSSTLVPIHEIVRRNVKKALRVKGMTVVRRPRLLLVGSTGMRWSFRMFLA
jgi:hypothetical protein